ncbi:MAG: zinc ribbon domain-containing protein [Candidatus Binataceae bacterium]
MLYFSAILIVVGVALYVAAPLAGGIIRRPHAIPRGEAERLEHEHALAVQGLRELEFDRAMGKLSQADYDALHLQLEERALGAMSGIEKLRGEARAAALHSAPRPSERQPAKPAPAEAGGAAKGRVVRYCPQCGAQTGAGFNFCGECGTGLSEIRRVAGEGG